MARIRPPPFNDRHPGKVLKTQDLESVTCAIDIDIQLVERNFKSNMKFDQLNRVDRSIAVNAPS